MPTSAYVHLRVPADALEPLRATSSMYGRSLAKEARLAFAAYAAVAQAFPLSGTPAAHDARVDDAVRAAYASAFPGFVSKHD
jgi:hypothetical protein